ncbi:hypothetical protein CEXT_79201 [Caerostris extrusa]|uniref:Uncharacterized protein n=1 Tax=Caerostris extrusa TaxID=172846 RepID=A0AAV4W9Y4_CAEEX|nr:hypothetical protein CEXT_79201 [Caerostris extrusa]
MVRECVWGFDDTLYTVHTVIFCSCALGNYVSLETCRVWHGFLLGIRLMPKAESRLLSFDFVCLIVGKYTPCGCVNVKTTSWMSFYSIRYLRSDSYTHTSWNGFTVSMMFAYIGD